MAWTIDNIATHCFYCGKPLDVGGLHGMEAVYFHEAFGVQKTTQDKKFLACLEV